MVFSLGNFISGDCVCVVCRIENRQFLVDGGPIMSGIEKVTMKKAAPGAKI